MGEHDLRIVYVDDDLSLRKVVKRAFEFKHPDVVIVTCGGGDELISRYRELQPDIILLDMQMPRMNGPDTIAALRAKPVSRLVPIVIVTGYLKIGMLEEYSHLGVIDIIHKPFDALELPDRIIALHQKMTEKQAESAFVVA